VLTKDCTILPASFLHDVEQEMSTRLSAVMLCGWVVKADGLFQPATGIYGINHPPLLPSRTASPHLGGYRKHQTRETGHFRQYMPKFHH